VLIPHIPERVKSGAVELVEEVSFDILIHMSLYFAEGTVMHKKVTDAQYEDAETKGNSGKYPGQTSFHRNYHDYQAL
jgi:hypothetical protein